MAVMAEKAPQDHRGHPGLLDPLENAVPLEETVKLAPREHAETKATLGGRENKVPEGLKVL